MPWDDEEQREISRRRWFVKHWFGRPYVVSNPEVEMEEPRREIRESKVPVRLGGRDYMWRNYEVSPEVGEGIRDYIKTSFRMAGERMQDPVYAALAFGPGIIKEVAPIGKVGGTGTKYLLNESAARFAESPVGKAVPEKVKPIDVWYHGTQREFESFATKGIKRGTGDIISRLGIHFAENEYVADMFAGGLYGKKDIAGRIIKARLKITNPMRYGVEAELRDAMGQWAIDSGLINPNTLSKSLIASSGKVGFSEGSDVIAKLKGPQRIKLVNGFVKSLKEQGYDGIVYGNVVEGYFGNRAAIAFSPEQIEKMR